MIQEALGAGVITRGEADSLAQEYTGLPNYFALEMSVGSAADAQAASEMAEIGENPVRSFMGSAGQGATFGFLDELVGLFDEDAGASMREAHNRRMEHAPGATVLSEMAGGAALPAVPGAAATRVRPGAARGFLSGAARGALTGALGGATTAAGLADPGERLEAAGTGARWGAGGGALFGGAFGAAGGLLAARSGRGTRVAEELVGLAEVPTSNRVIARGRIRDAKDVIQATLYEPLSEGGAQIGDAHLNQTIANLAQDDMVGDVVALHLSNRVGPLAEGRWIPGDVGATFEEAQMIRRTLRDVAGDFQTDPVRRRAAEMAADRIDEAMGDAFGEPLRIADRAWRRVSDRERAFESGIRMYDARSEEILDLMLDMTPAQQEAFNQGRLSEITAALGRRDTEVVSLLRDMMDAGPELLTSMRYLFDEGEGGQAAFEVFTEMLARESRDQAIVDFFNSAVKSAAIGVAGGATAGGLFNAFGDTER